MIALLILVGLDLLVSLADLYVSARFARPMKRRAMHADLADLAAAAAEQKFRGQKNAGTEKARFARQHLIDNGVKPAAATVLVERAVSKLQPKDK